MRAIKTSFAGGEFAPDLDGRVDIEKYQTAAQKIDNFIVTRYGGASNRPGTTFVDYTRSTGDIKLVPFEFNVDQTYVLEFTDVSMRVIKDGGVVQKSYRNASYAWANYSGSIYCLTTAAGGDPTIAQGLQNFNVYENGTRMTAVSGQPTQAGEFSVALNPGGGTYYTIWIWLSDGTDPDSKAVDYIMADYVLDTPYTSQYLTELDWAQDSDTLFMAHPDVSPRKIQRFADNLWTQTAMTFTPTNSAPTDIDAVLTGFAASDRDVVYAISSISDELEESLPSADVTVSLDLNWPTAGRVDLYWNSIRSATFKWTASGSGTNEYYLELAAGGDPSIDEPSIVYEDKVEMTAGTLGSLTAGTWDYGDNDSLGYDTIYVCLSDSSDPDTKGVGYLTYKGTTDDQWSVYKNYRGDWGWLGTVQTPWFLDDNIEGDVSVAPKTFTNQFAASGDYPATVGMFEQRLFYARTNNDPMKVWTSYSGHSNNFGKSKPLTAADPIEARLKSGTGRNDEIRHLLPLDKLIMFTAGSEWVFDHGDNSDALTPFSIRFRPQGSEGSIKDLQPLKARSNALFVARNSKDVFSIVPSDSLYTSNELTLLVPHLFEGRTIIDWTYVQHPYNVVFMVMSDGDGVMLTYLPEQEIYAFSRMTTDGYLKAVCSVTSDGEDEVYFVVERTLNGSVVRCVEQLHSRAFTRIEDAYFVDCGLSYDEPKTITGVVITATEVTVTAVAHGFSDGDFVRITEVEGIDATETPHDDYPSFNDKWYKVANKATDTFELHDYDGVALTSTHFSGTYERNGKARESVITVSGLDHLEGESIKLLADGNVINATVSSGSVTLADAHPGYATVHAGLAYNSDIQTLRLAEDTNMGTMQGEKKRIKNAVFRMKNSVGGSAGIDEASLIEFKWRQNEDWAEANGLLTGDKEHVIKGGWNTDGRVYFRQSEPLPSTILSIIMRFDNGGRS